MSKKQTKPVPTTEQAPETKTQVLEPPTGNEPENIVQYQVHDRVPNAPFDLKETYEVVAETLEDMQKEQPGCTAHYVGLIVGMRTSDGSPFAIGRNLFNLEIGPEDSAYFFTELTKRYLEDYKCLINLQAVRELVKEAHDTLLAASKKTDSGY